MTLLGKLVSPMMLGGRGLGAPPPAATIWPYPTDKITGHKGPPSWAEVGPGGILDSELAICFPKAAFDSWKAHLLKQSQRYPKTHAELVYWSLDVWAHINYCLFALNIPLNGARGLFWGTQVSDRPITTRQGGRTVLNPFYDTIRDFYQMAEVDKSSALQAARYEFQSAGWKNQASAAPILPAPFMTLVPMWFGALDRNPGYSPYKIRELANTQILPWMRGGMNLPSKGSKDRSDNAQALRDPAFQKARMEWRMWSMRDYFPWSARKEWLDDVNLGDYLKGRMQYPRFMGSVQNTSTLGTYMAKSASEGVTERLEFTGAGWAPNLAYASRGLRQMARKVFGMDYEATVRAHVEEWYEQAQPPLDDTGELREFRFGEGTRKEMMAVTPEDFRDIRDQKDAAVKRRLQLTLSDPVAACKAEAGDEEWKKASCAASAKAMSTVKDIPVFGWAYKGMTAILNGLVEWLGAARGWSYSPFFVMPAPFTRSVKAPGYYTVPSGSTADVLPRIHHAITAIQAALDLNISPWVPKPGQVQYQARVVMIDSEGNPTYAPVSGTAPLTPQGCGEMLDLWLTMRPVPLKLAERNMVTFDCVLEAQGKRPKGSALATFTKIADQYGGGPAANCAKVIDAGAKNLGVVLSPDQRKRLLYFCGQEMAGKLAKGSTLKALHNIAPPAPVPALIVTRPTAKKTPWGLLVAGGLAAGAIVVARKR